MKDKKLVTFWLDKQKHAKFKTKTSSIGSNITKELTKFIDFFIGKGDLEKEEKNKTISNLQTKINSIPPKRENKQKVELPEPEYAKEE